MKSSYRLLMVAFLSLILVGCSKTGGTSNVERPAIEIPSMNTGIGGIEDKEGNHDLQRYFYNITLANNEDEEVLIKEIQLVLPSEFEVRLVDKALNVPVNKSISPKSFINVSGTLDFNAAGLSKEDIIKLNPHIESVKVINEKIISLEKWSSNH